MGIRNYVEKASRERNDLVNNTFRNNDGLALQRSNGREAGCIMSCLRI
jgi:hypothetical protein